MFCLFVSLFKWQLFTFSLEVCRRGDGFTDGTRDKRGLGFTETCSLCYITLFLFTYRNILLSKKHAWTTGHVVRLDYNLFIKNNTDSELKVLIKLKYIKREFEWQLWRWPLFIVDWYKSCSCVKITVSSILLLVNCFDLSIKSACADRLNSFNKIFFDLNHVVPPTFP